MKLPLFFITLFVIISLPARNGASDFRHGKEWVDPDPLSKINGDFSSKSVIKGPRNPDQANKDGMKSELELCEQSLKDCSVQLHDLKYNPSLPPPSKQESHNMSSEQQDCMQSKVYMKRFINILLEVSKLQDDMPQNLDTHLYITVMPQQLKILQKFSKGSNDVTLQELDHVLASVLLSSKSGIFSEEYIPWSIVTDFVQSREMLMAFILGCLPLLLMWKLLNGHSIFRLMTMFLMSSFFISFSVTYCRMYKQAVIKQYAVMKMNPEEPVECRPPSELTWTETIGGLLRTKLSYNSDECQKYYEAVMLDPFLEITPAIVLAEMVAGFVLYPSGMLGSAIAKFSNSVLGNLPFGVNWLVLIGSFFLLIVIIFVSCGGFIRLPFYMGGMVLSGQRPQEMITAGPQTKQGVEEMEQPSGCPVLNDTAVSGLMQTAATTDTGLVIMNIPGVQWFLSSGNTTMIHRNAVEEIKLPSPKRKDSYSYEQKGKTYGDKAVPIRSGHLELSVRKYHREKLRLRKTAASGESKNGHTQTERMKVVTKHTRGSQKEEEIEELSSTGENMLTYNRAASTTGDISKMWKSDVEDKVSRCRSGSIDGSDEETSFVKL